ncbi:MAG: P-II family nitrogen regulator [Opitutaceae bacterium]|nr:P-II family nitrogen regulator [Opitutaceae bacterium]
MKEITAIIQPHTLSHVVEALHALPHFPGLTVFDNVHGQGRGRGAGGAFLLTEHNINFHKKVLLLIACDDALADAVVVAIAAHARTGNTGDGIIVVKDATRVIRIRTGETAGQAV